MVNNMKPQRERILAALKNGAKLTPLTAVERFECLALSQRIGELKRQGYPIQMKMVSTKTGKRVAQYSLPSWYIDRERKVKRAKAAA